MAKISIPDNYPKACSIDIIKKVVEECQNEIAKLNETANVGSTYYTQLAEQGNAELNRRLNEKLILNLEESSKRQRNLTRAIIFIGLMSLIGSAITLCKTFGII